MSYWAELKVFWVSNVYAYTCTRICVPVYMCARRNLLLVRKIKTVGATRSQSNLTFSFCLHTLTNNIHTTHSLTHNLTHSTPHSLTLTHTHSSHTLTYDTHTHHTHSNLLRRNVKGNSSQINFSKIRINYSRSWFSNPYIFATQCHRSQLYLGFPIKIPLRAIARNCVQLFWNCAQLCKIACNF